MARKPDGKKAKVLRSIRVDPDILKKFLSRNPNLSKALETLMKRSNQRSRKK
jgi:hypothetical protein